MRRGLRAGGRAQVLGLAVAVAAGAAAVLAFTGLVARASTLLSTGGAAATITSDQADYAPGSTVTLTGANWAAGEQVHIVVNDRDGQTWQYSDDVLADDTGAITDTFQLPTAFVAVYDVTATGPTSGTATTSFTDTLSNILVTASPPTPGVNSKYTISFTAPAGIAVGDMITLQFPNQAAVPTGITASNVTVNNGTSTASPTSTPGVSGSTVTIKAPNATAVNGTATVVIGSTTPVIGNPSTAGLYNVKVQTTKDANNGTAGSVYIDTPPTATVALSPKPATTNQTLTATATKSDAETTDTVTLTYVWRVNGVTKKTTAASGSLTDTFDLSTAGFGNKGDTVSVTVTPNDGHYDGSAVSDNLNVANSAPTATAQSTSTNENTAKTITLSASDPDNDPLTFTSASGPSHGTLGTISAASCSAGTCTATVSYAPTTNYWGADSFTFTASDGTAASTAATVSMTVNHVNQPPAAQAVTTSGPQDAPLSITLRATDVDGNGLSFAPGAAGHGTVSPGAPTASCTGVGTSLSTCTATVTYTPSAGYVGPDSFSYTVSDGNGGSNTALVTISVLHVNHAPTADAKSATLPEDGLASVTLTGSDPDGDPLAYQVVTLPAHGIVNAGSHTIQPSELPYTVSGTTTVTAEYDGALNYNGSDSFTYVASDGSLTSAPATVSLAITPVDDRPNANDYSVAINSPNATSLDLSTATNSDSSLLVHDVETPNNALTYTIVTQPAKGTLTAGGTPGAYSYRPNPTASGTDTATYAVTDRGDPDNCGTPSASCSASLTSVTYTITFNIAATIAPPVTSGLELLFDADSISQPAGSAVTQWNDGSGNHRDLTTGGAFNAAPTLRLNAVNGHAAVEFDGVNSLLKTYNSTFTIAQPDTFFIVYKSADPASDTTRGFVFDSMDSTQRQSFGREDDQTQRMYANLDFDAGGVTFPFSAYEIWSGTFNGSSSSMYENGGLLATGSVGAASLMTGFTLGGLNAGTTLGYDRGHNYIAKLLLYSGALTDSQRSSITDWLNQEYNAIGPPTPPTNTTPPSLTGSAIAGSTLTASKGAWSGSVPLTYTYEIRRCDTTGANCVAVGTSPTYQVTSADVGYQMRVAVTAHNSAGSSTAVSDPTAVVTQPVLLGSDPPPVTQNLQMWYDASDESYADGARVTTFHDLSGYGRNLTNAFSDASDAPTFHASTFNGHPALEFDGTRSLLKTYGSNFALAQPDTFFIVYQDLNSGEGYIVDSMDSNSRQILGRGPGNVFEMYANNSLNATPTFPFPSAEVWSGSFHDGGSTLYQNGTLVASGNTGVAPLAGLTVGAMNSSGSFGFNYSHALVAELLWYSGDLSSADKQSVASYLMHKYGIGAPTATLNAPTTTVQGTAATISLDNAQTTSTNPLHYAFACDGSSLSSATYSTAGTSSSTTCTFTDTATTHTVRARVIDSNDLYTEYTATIAVTPAAPTATFTTATSVTEGASAHLSLDNPTGNGPFTYAFDCGSGTFGSFSSASSTDCATIDNGTLAVRGKIKDANGNATTYTATVVVTNVAPSVTAPPAQSTSEGGSTLFQLGSFSDPGANDGPWHASIDWGDGTATSAFDDPATGTLGTLTHTYATHGSYTATVTVADTDGDAGSASFAVTVADVPPTGTLSNNGPVPEGSAATIDVSNQSDVSLFDVGAGFEYAYACDGSNFGAVTTDPTTTCAFADAGDHIVLARIYDVDGGYTVMSTTVHVTNVAPTVTAPADQNASEGTSAGISLGSFTDPGANDGPWSITVAWGDGTSTSYSTNARGSLGSLPHTYADNGSKTVTVTAIDNGGLSGSAIFHVNVANVAPTVTAPPAQNAAEGAAVVLPLGSFSDPGTIDGPWQVRVNWGDGSVVVSFTQSTQGSLGVLTHAYSNSGTDTVTVTVTDKDTGSSSASYSVAVADTPPTATLSNNGPVSEGSPATISFTGQSDPSPADVSAGFHYTYACDGSSFGSSTTSASATCNNFPDNADYTVKARIYDQDNRYTEYSTTVHVNNVAPTVTAAANQTATEGTAASFNLGSFTDPGAGDGPWHVSVAWGDGGTSTFDATARGSLGTYAHTYTDNASRTVTVTVTDKDGGSGSASFTVTVANAVPAVTAPAAQTATEGSAALLPLGSFADSGAGDTPWQVNVTWGDGSAPATFTQGTQGSLGSLTHTYADSGVKTVTVTVTDKDGGVGSSSYAVTVANVPPTATLSNNGPVNEGSPVTISFSNQADVSSVDAAQGFTYSYACDGGSFGTPTTSAQATCTFNDNGSKTVAARIIDKDNGSTTYTTTVTVNNVAPTATFTATPTIDEGSSATLTFTSPTDPSSADTAAGLTYAFACDGLHFGTAAASATTTCAFTVPGTYTVAGEIRDKDNGYTDYSAQVVVRNVAPTLTAPATQSASEGNATNFSVGSFSDPGTSDGPWSVTVDWGDTSTSSFTSATQGTLPQQAHTYANPGTYTATVTVTDNGPASTSKTFSIVVGNLAPTVTAPASPQSANEGASTAFSLGSFNDASAGDGPWSVSVNWGDGTTETLSASTRGTLGARSHTYANYGSFTVGVTVTDSGGLSDTKSFTVNVANIAPTVSSTTNQSAGEGTAASIDVGSFSDPGANDGPWSVRVNWGDGSTDDTFSASTRGALGGRTHAFALSGNYTVTVTVSDKGTASGSQTFTVSVQNVAPTVTAAANQSVSEGSAGTFNVGSFTDPGASDGPWAVDVDWGDGSPHTAFNAATVGSLGTQPHTYLTAGSYTATVKVTDKFGAYDSKSFTITATNVAPTVAVTGAPATSAEGTPITLGSTVTDPGVGETLAYSWSITKGGAQVAAGSAPSITFVPDDNATWAATLTVTDGKGGSGYDTKSITVTNVAPTASTANSGPIAEGSSATISASGAFDPSTVDTTAGFHYAFSCNGPISPAPTYATAGTSSSTSCAYDDGTRDYIASVAIVDKDGGYTTSTTTVHVNDVPPSATFAPPLSVTEGSGFSLALTTPSDPSVADSATFQYTFDCGSGTYGLLVSTSTADCGSLSTGAHTVRATIVDKDASTEYVRSLNVTNIAPTPAITGAPASSPEGTTIALTGSATDPGGPTDVKSYAWSVTKNNVAYGAGGSGTAYTFTPDDNGTYVITLTATDADGATGATTATITVTNVAPVPTLANPPSTGVEGSPITVSGSSTDAGTIDSGTLSQSWTVANAGGTVATGSGPSVTFTPGVTGTYTVTLAVSDKDGANASTSTTIAVSNVAPSPTITGAPATSPEGTAITLGSTTGDPGAGRGDTFGYAWSVTKGGSSFGSAGSGSGYTFTPNDNGSYVVTLAVTDRDGTTGTVQKTITVTNVAPTATLGNSGAINEGSAATISFSNVSDPSSVDAASLHYAFSCDGSPAQTNYATASTSATTTCTFDDGPATKTVNAAVIDKDGAYTTATTTVQVNNVAPTAAFNAPASVNEGGAIALSLTAPSDPSAADRSTGFSYSFDCGAGWSTWSSTATYSCATSTPGVRTVRAQIEDKDGGVGGPYTQTVTVDNVDPTVTAPATQSVDEGSAGTFSLGSFADPGSDQPWTADVNWGDGTAHSSASYTSTGSLGSLGHTYADSGATGTYTVTVTLTDNFGGSGSQTFTVNVRNVPPTATLSGPTQVTTAQNSTYTFGPVTDPSVPDQNAGFHYAYDCNGGSLASSTYGNSPASNLFTCGWATTGTKTITSRVIDQNNGYTDYALTVTVTAPPPTVTFSASNATTINEGTASTTQYTYSYTTANATSVGMPGCGTLGTLVSGSATYTASTGAGSFKCTFNSADGTATSTSTVSITATGTGGSTTGTQTVRIANVAPTVTISSPLAYTTVLVNSTMTFSTGFTDPGPDGAWKWHIDWGDGTVSDGTTTSKSIGTSHVYKTASPASPGYTTITVTVTDKDGGTGTATRIIYVR